MRWPRHRDRGRGPRCRWNRDIAASVVGDSGRVEIFHGLTDHSFEISDRLAAGSSPSAIAAGDLDGDGHIDLAIVDPVDQTLTVFVNTGHGFASGVRIPCEPYPSSVVIADLTRDGLPEIAVTRSGINQVSVYHNWGNHDWTTRSDFTTPGYGSYQGTSITAGDVDGDGWTDLAVGGYGDAGEIMWNDSTGFFPGVTRFEGRYDYYASTNQACVLADFDHDGRLDLCSVGGDGHGDPIWVTAPVESGLSHLLGPRRVFGRDGFVGELPKHDRDGPGWRWPARSGDGRRLVQLRLRRRARRHASWVAVPLRRAYGLRRRPQCARCIRHPRHPTGIPP